MFVSGGEVRDSYLHRKRDNQTRPAVNNAPRLPGGHHGCVPSRLALHNQFDYLSGEETT
jgi:hypothetical protein